MNIEISPSSPLFPYQSPGAAVGTQPLIYPAAAAMPQSLPAATEMAAMYQPHYITEMTELEQATAAAAAAAEVRILG